MTSHVSNDTLASPFVTLFREVSEMRYRWQQPLQLDNRKLVAPLGAEPHTDLDEAISATLRGMGCLTADAESSASKARSDASR